MRRPTPEQAANHEAAWAEYMKSGSDETPIIMSLVAADPTLACAFHDQFVAACFIEDLLTEMGAPASYRKEVCLKFGQACLGRDAWTTFDLFFPKCEAEVLRFTNNIHWTSTAVVQNVPPATNLLDEWWRTAKNFRGERGVFPQVFLTREHSGQVNLHALALSGTAATNSAIAILAATNPAEFVLGIDRLSMPGQGLEFGDFLGVVWYHGGQFYTGVVDYQRATSDPPVGEVEPAFRPLRWDNNYWNHSLRETGPIPEMKRALEKANTPRGDA